MRIAVTGAAGRLGRTLTGRLAERGHTVVPIDVAPPVSLPLSDRDGLIAACADTDVVVHLAARMFWQRTDDAALFETNVLGTANVAEAAALAGAKLVLASTGEVYPEGNPVYQPLDEDHPRAPTSAYGLTKKLAEDTVDFYRRTRGLEAVVLRFSHFQDAAELLDPNSFFSGPRFFLHRKIEQQRAFGNAAAVAALEPHDDGTTKLVLSRGEDGTPFRMGILDTRDLASGVVAAVETPGLDGEVIGLGADDSVDFDWLVPELAHRAGLNYVDVRLPGPAVHYTTSNAKARELLGFTVEFPVSRMIAEAEPR
ncbi:MULTISPECIES: NAD-dependent epimerase/dehydratase family protein [Amycolatopsis]|uniref:NAD-dependent epimerase/dehydratase family protein n=1 Tax=Amycolatopsis TaxID=1813 RepID=UPI000B8B686B|nr:MULTISPECIES: NAD(P)-dependent oxidoreductase [Amycolatopsis]OXM71470.1 nucleoside-diphosphate sugar epimerase [Amycolatopsis sp. KNN50.9b]